LDTNSIRFALMELGEGEKESGEPVELTPMTIDRTPITVFGF
jgi:hypothetical protein